MADGPSHDNETRQAEQTRWWRGLKPVEDYCYQLPSREGNGGIEQEMRIRRIVNLPVQVLLSVNHEENNPAEVAGAYMSNP